MIDKEPAMSKPTIEQTRIGTEGIAFCIARTLIERDPSLKAPMRANLRKMWELLEEREDHGAARYGRPQNKGFERSGFFQAVTSPPAAVFEVRRHRAAGIFDERPGLA